MGWYSRNESFMKRAAPDLIDLAEATQCRTMLGDAEKYWHEGNMPVDEAADLTKELFANKPCPFGITGLAKLQRSLVKLIDVVDYRMPQAYPIWKPGKEKHWSHSKATEPVTIQETAWNTWNMADNESVIGLGCYWAMRPARYGWAKMGQLDSMYRALHTSLALGSKAVAYWSLKHLHGNKWARQRAEFIRRIRLEPSSLRALVAQEMLGYLGYDLGKYGPLKDGVDGVWGRRSKAVLTSFRNTEKLSTGGLPGDDDLLVMRKKLDNGVV
jgi:hypothetical protein